LGKREYSRAELGQKISAYANSLEINPAEINNVLNDLEREAWLSDKRFTDQYIFSKKNKYGLKKISYELKLRGVDEQIINKALCAIKAEELLLAQAIWKKKFNGLPNNQQEKIKQIRFLQGRGIDSSTIHQVLSGKFIENYENTN